MDDHSFHLETRRLDFSVVEAMPGIGALMQADDPNYTLLAVTDDFARSFGLTKKDLSGKGFFEALLKNITLSNEEQTNLLTSFQFAAGQKKAHEISLQRYQILKADGSVLDRYWSVSNKPITDEAGNVSYILYTAQDITEKIKTDIKEERIREIENLHNLFLQAPVAICIVSGPNYIVELVNERMLQFLGRASSIIGQPIEATLTESKVQGLTAILDTVYTTKKPYYISVFPAVILINGIREQRYFDLVFKPYFLHPSDKEASAIFCVAHNVTEQVLARKKVENSEADLQQKVQERTADLERQHHLLDNILKHSSNGISVSEMIRDEEGKILDAKIILTNKSAVKFTGLPLDVFLSKTAIELDPNLVGSSYYHMCLKTLKTGEPSLIQYYLEQTGKWLELTVSKMDEDHLIHIFTDVTPIKESQIQLERTVEDLKRSNTNLEEFAYAASHDLKEPIRKIQLFADRLRNELKGKLDEGQSYLFSRMEQAAGRMSLLVDDLLAYSHVSMGTDRMEQIDLNKKLKLVLEDLDVQVQEKKAKIMVSQLPVITGHRRQMQQLFQNLIGNALKYSKADVPPEIYISSKKLEGKEVGIELPEEEKAKPFYLIEIKDNGIGFDPEDAGKIFNVFTRLHGNKEYSGTGVGLSIVRKVVENHKGYIWAESKKGEGAVFKILLPAV